MVIFHSYVSLPEGNRTGAGLDMTSRCASPGLSLDNFRSGSVPIHNLYDVPSGIQRWQLIIHHLYIYICDYDRCI